ncbi:MAG TPA: hypothetical protein VHA75_10010 [Rugosimonospora sp.]|nr:hypothetical protein [Rugosimonospora sp.]
MCGYAGPVGLGAAIPHCDICWEPLWDADQAHECSIAAVVKRLRETVAELNKLTGRSDRLTGYLASRRIETVDLDTDAL